MRFVSVARLVLLGMAFGVAGCATYSKVFVNDEGQVLRCAASGYGDGLYAASMSYNSCVEDVRKLGGFVELPNVVWGVKFVLTTSPLRVKEIAARSPAEISGIASGDVLIELDGKAVRKYTEVMEILAGKKDGDELQAVIDRDGRQIALTSILRSR